ncbi:MAG: alcohol dehydrogenase [Lysobacterales bacterium]|jgi:alcohol dehydrogenase
MRAAYYTEFEGEISIENFSDPTPGPSGVVIAVRASGLCRSDWHGWMGHDSDIKLPHVPGHELSGVVEAIGSEVARWNIGDRVTLPFVCGCGRCEQCDSGNHQVCDRQFQPGFTHWGSFAQFVAVDYADTNLVHLPEEVDFVTAASLGCRFATAFRAVVDQGAVKTEQWLAVHGCGGVGLSAIMIAKAMGANVVAIDISRDKLDLAKISGADLVINSTSSADVIASIKEATGGGAHISIDAVGFPDTCFNSVSCLRKRGKHIQVGILTPQDRNSRLPMNMIVAGELEIYGSHGMQAHRYPKMLEMVLSGQLKPQNLVNKLISLEEAPARLISMDNFEDPGITVIDRF